MHPVQFHLSNLGRRSALGILVLVVAVIIGGGFRASVARAAGGADAQDPTLAQPTSATLTCGNNMAGIGETLTLTSLTGAAQNCTVNFSCLAGGSASINCADGTVSVDLEGLSGGSVLTCGTDSNLPALQSCTAHTSGTSLNIPCGSTAPNGTTQSATCTNVNFNIQSALAACLNNPLSGCGANGNSQSGCVTILLDYEATVGNGGSPRLFGTVSVCFPAASLGALVVSCQPNVIPSNGTLASVCTATFAGTQTVAAFLTGTFLITSPGGAILDNGRQSETIPCGVASAITPATFSCTGVSFLAIGSGAAGDAPINVSYTSAVGGAQAVGSALLTAVPSGAPKVAISCTNGSSTDPTNTIVAGGAGAFCTASVTDQNGVPLVGITGAGVTFTVSNPSAAVVIPCATAITVTSGLGVGSCATLTGLGLVASSPTLGQVVTVPTGFSSAEVVASANATPQTITVTESLGVFVPPAFLCFIGGTSVPGITQPSNCGAAGEPGLATGLNPASLGFGGTIALPNATSASATLDIAIAPAPAPPPPQIAPPAAPTNLQASVVDSTDIQLTWTNNATNADSIQVYDGMTNQQIASADGAATSATLSNLAPGSHYCAYLYALNSAGYSDASNLVCADTPPS